MHGRIQREGLVGGDQLLSRLTGKGSLLYFEEFIKSSEFSDFWWSGSTVFEGIANGCS